MAGKIPFQIHNAVKILKNFGISVELIDLRTKRPLDYETIYKSVRKTKRIIVVDNGFKSFSVSAEIISSVTEKLFSILIKSPVRIANKDMPIPSSRELAKFCYPTKYDIITSALKLMDLDNKFKYKGPKPFSKETAILMMCDSVEAASKSLKNPTSVKINNFVDSIISSQIEMDQFLNSNITFKEIESIKKVLKHKLANIYHLRIEYPD